MDEGGEDEGGSIEFTPTWVVAAVCTVIVSISLALERLLHYTGKLLKFRYFANMKPVRGYTTVSQGRHLKRKKQKHLYEALQKVKEELMLLGFISLLLTVFQSRIVKFCVPHHVVMHLLPCSLLLENSASNDSVHYHAGPHHLRRLLTEEMTDEGYCQKKNKVPLLPLEALHHLHIFIFVLAIVHVIFSVLTIVFGGAKIRQWKHWEDAIIKDDYESEHDTLKPAVTYVHEHEFIRKRFKGIGKQSAILGWAHSFFKQFYASVNESDYRALRLGFIMFPVFQSRNLTKLEHVIIQLAHEIAEKHVAVEFQYGFNSCIMGKYVFVIPRLVIGVFIQVLCSYSTLPLYAIVPFADGSHYKKSMLNKCVQACLLDWAEKVKRKKAQGPARDISSLSTESFSTITNVCKWTQDLLEMGFSSTWIHHEFVLCFCNTGV
ncbi:hypothetical protein HAX54_015423 [Datura stramonium]|uniref:MLO-like protein n=1 Tax=Datura stramonium TaxID=4076 RepID=A0ABS8TPM5_DATST|nr:hypothetical protein [Datura stramonium]